MFITDSPVQSNSTSSGVSIVWSNSTFKNGITIVNEHNPAMADMPTNKKFSRACPVYFGKTYCNIRLSPFIISLLDSSREQFTEAEYMKIRNSILSAPEESISDKLAALFYSDTQCSVYNGLGSLNTNKVANMVKFFIHKEGSVFPTKLNKEMFYADFAHYRKHGRSISGLRYKAIKYGPVPYHYDTIYDNIDGVEKNIVISHNSESTCLSCDGYDSKSFSADELATLEHIFAITQELTTEQIVDKSHQEPAWANYNSQGGFIPYSEAFNLILL